MEPVLAGTLRHLEDLLTWTDPADFDLHLAVSAERDPSVRQRFDRWRGAGRPVYEVPMRRKIAPWRDALAFRQLLALCRRERFDIVHTHCAKAGFLGRLAGRLSGARTVHTPHVFPFGRAGGWGTEGLYLLLERLAGRWTDRVVLLSRYQMNVVLHRRPVPADRAVIIPNGVEPDRLSLPDRQAARRELGIGPDAPVALMVGRLCPQKGVDVLIEGAAMVPAGVEDVRVIIVGAGPIEEQLRQRVAELGAGSRIAIVGETDRVGLYYAACDLVVAPSRYEGMPYVLLEAMAAGRAVAAGLVSGMEEFVRPAQGGFLLPPERPAAVAALLTRLCRDRAAFHEAGRRARAVLRPHWAARQTVAGLHALYRSLL